MTIGEFAISDADFEELCAWLDRRAIQIAEGDSTGGTWKDHVLASVKASAKPKAKRTKK